VDVAGLYSETNRNVSFETPYLNSTCD